MALIGQDKVQSEGQLMSPITLWIEEKIKITFQSLLPLQAKDSIYSCQMWSVQKLPPYILPKSLAA